MIYIQVMGSKFISQGRKPIPEFDLPNPNFEYPVSHPSSSVDPD